jgi:hypothetical protein
MTTVAALEVVAPIAAWQAAGLPLVDGEAIVDGIAIRMREPATDELARIERWVLADCPTEVTTIDGLPTARGVPLSSSGRGEGLLAGSRFDHLVVMTSSLERTCAAIEGATAAPLKRIREAGPVRQGFHRLGGLIIEVVETAQVTVPHALFWGFVLIVDDLHEVCAALGPELISLPKQAVQPGRQIATFRQGAGLGVPTALMTP